MTKDVKSADQPAEQPGQSNEHAWSIETTIIPYEWDHRAPEHSTCEPGKGQVIIISRGGGVIKK